MGQVVRPGSSIHQPLVRTTSGNIVVYELVMMGVIVGDVAECNGSWVRQKKNSQKKKNLNYERFQCVGV